MRIAIYVRVSTGRQAEEGVSIDGQIAQITAWAEREGHEVVETYKEMGATGTDDRRPEFRRMMADAISTDHPFSAIVVFALSRFFRDAYELARNEKILKRAKVSLISITQPTGEDEAGQMIRGIVATFDEYQSRENGKNVRRSMTENAQQGYFNGSRPPFGYIAEQTEVKGRNGYKRRLGPCPDEADVVRTIFSLAVVGESGEPHGIKKIATVMNERGQTYRGKRWTRGMVWNIVTSSTYCGDYVYNRTNARSGEDRPESEWVIVKVPAIVTREQFDKAAALRAERAPGGASDYRAPSSPTLLTGLAKCDRCGAGFVLASGKGGNYDYYRCGTRAYKGSGLCDAPNIPREELDATVLQAIAHKVLDLSRIESMLGQLRENIAALHAPDRVREKKIQRDTAIATEQINMWFEQVEAGKLELHETLRTRLAAAQLRIDQMSAELREIGHRRQIPLKKFGETQIKGFADAIKTEILKPGSPYAKSYLRALVSEIRIGPDNGYLEGNHADMAGAVSGWRPDKPELLVPRHVSSWRARQESNLRPSA